VKIDCGEFQHSHEISKLIGSPPGYIGHRETPALNVGVDIGTQKLTFCGHAANVAARSPAAAKALGIPPTERQSLYSLPQGSNGPRDS
jgi:hypothetical protein